MVWHEFFSAASRVGVVATMEGWKGAKCAILGTEIGGDRASGSHGRLCLLQRIFSDDIMRSNCHMESQLSVLGKVSFGLVNKKIYKNIISNSLSRCYEET